MTVYEQLSAYCGCSTINESDVDELIYVLSQMTCWNSGSDGSFCNTFLNGARREVIDLFDCTPKCGIIYFYPFYYPFDRNSFSFRVAHISGIEETVEDVTQVNWLESKGAFGIDLSDIIPSCRCANRCAPCREEYKLIVEYDAGYEMIPECILPVMCNLMDVIEAKNNCDCDNECQSCTSQNTTVNPLTGQLQTSVQTIKYASGDLTTVQLETEIARMLVESYKTQLGLISLCSSRKELWGTVV